MMRAGLRSERSNVSHRSVLRELKPDCAAAFEQYAVRQCTDLDP
jgi:hypothetical protein